jgi:uncharacterized protein YpuA (DUF1002 family)
MRKEEFMMSQQGVSKDVLNAVKKATGKQLSQQAVKTIASGVNQKTMQDGAELRKLIDKVSKMVNIPVSNETVNEIITAVKKTGNIDQLESMMKTMMKK